MTNAGIYGRILLKELSVIATKLTKLNIRHNDKYFDISEALELRRMRKKSILTTQDFAFKYDELTPLYGLGKQVYVYKNSDCSMYGIQIYSVRGEIILTYPWNDKFSLINEGQLVSSFNESLISKNEVLRTVDIIIKGDRLTIVGYIDRVNGVGNVIEQRKDVREFDFEGNEINPRLVNSEMSIY